MEYNDTNNLNDLFDVLQDHQVLAHDELETYIHALVDIKESLEKIYDEYIMNILKNKNKKELVIDNFWDIREEFRHIEYHMKDAKLTE